jgi:hypothetical protein
LFIFDFPGSEVDRSYSLVMVVGYRSTLGMRSFSDNRLYFFDCFGV